MQNILPIHWKIQFLYKVEILRALRFNMYLRANRRFWNAPQIYIMIFCLHTLTYNQDSKMKTWEVYQHHQATFLLYFHCHQLLQSSSFHNSPLRSFLTHWGRDTMADISQTTFSNAFSWMKIHQFRLIFHWSLFLRIELTIFQHWFR